VTDTACAAVAVVAGAMIGTGVTGTGTGPHAEACSCSTVRTVVRVAVNAPPDRPLSCVSPGRITPLSRNTSTTPL
jgi:pyrimidine deaminase RibD-like protein